MGKPRYKEVSERDKKAFLNLLSEDEELILATGYGRTYLRQRFIIQLMLPGVIFIFGGFALFYFYHPSLPEGLINLWVPGNGLILGLVLAGVFSYLQTLWLYHANRYLLTTRRVILKRGLVNVKLVSALYDKITHIELNQGFVDRFFLHHGQIKIHTAGSEKDELVLDYVESPIEFKNILERLINSERERFNKNITPVVEIEGELVEENKLRK